MAGLREVVGPSVKPWEDMKETAGGVATLSRD